MLSPRILAFLGLSAPFWSHGLQIKFDIKSNTSAPFCINNLNLWQKYLQRVYPGVTWTDVSNATITNLISQFTIFYLFDDFFPKDCLPFQGEIPELPHGINTFYTKHDKLWGPQLFNGQVIYRYPYDFYPNPNYTYWNEWPHPLPWHPLQNGIPNHTRVEVSHVYRESKKRVESGYWMYAQVGSGVFYDVGRTVIFHEQQEAESFMLGGKGRDFGQMCEIAKSRGFDSLQFTHRAENIFKMEILDCRAGTKVFGEEHDGCPYGIEQHFSVLKSLRSPQESFGANLRLTIGSAAEPFNIGQSQQQGEFGSCKCLPSRTCLNCDGFPSCSDSR